MVESLKKRQENIVVIAVSNKEKLIDQATKDRFEPSIFYTHPPLTDREWNEVVEIHLRKFKRYIDSEANAAKITRLFRRQRILSPRAAAEIIAEAHRLWASELSAISEICSSRDEAHLASIKSRYGAEM